MIKNGVYFIVIALLVAELFKILIYANLMTCDVTGWTHYIFKVGMTELYFDAIETNSA